MPPLEFVQRPPIEAEYAFRSAADGSPIFEGYAAVFDTPSKPITDQFGVGYIETIKPSTFARSLSTPGKRHTFVVDHNDALLLSATTSGRLKLGTDTRGLHVESSWPGTDYANNVRALHDAGEKLGMSFTSRWTPRGHEWDATRTRHTVTDAALGHVTVLTWREPAYDGTMATFRALAEKTESDMEDIEVLFDALKAGRALNEDEHNLLTRLAAATAPAGEETVARSQPEELDPKQTLAYWQGRFPTLG